jgi:hypothetical protein
MPIKLDCPRCKQSMAVPRRKIGGYVLCPRCKGRLWVPDGATEEPGLSGSGSELAALDPDLTATSNASGGSGIFSGPVPPVGPPPIVSAPGSIPLAPSVAGGTGSFRVPPAPPLPPGRSAAAAPATVAGPAIATLSSGSIPLAASLHPSPAANVSAGSLPPGAVAANMTPGAPPVAPPIVPGRGKKVARFISAEMSQSPLKASADGKLPELQLNDGQAATSTEAKSTTVSPLVLMAVLSVSVAFSVMAVFMDFGPSQGTHAREKAEARAFIEKNYFPDQREMALDPKKKPEPYQLWLQDAQQAHERHDRKAERAMYLKVLDRLHQERGTFQKGLTGSSERDKKLEEQIIILLRED